MWTLTVLRAVNLASATIEQALRSVVLLYVTLDELGVTLDSRMDDGQFLTLAEVEILVNQCKLRVGESSKAKKTKVIPFSLNQRHAVEAKTVAIRLRYIRNYIDWIAKERLFRTSPKSQYFESLTVYSRLVVEAIEARIPTSGNRQAMDSREGLSPDVLERLVNVIHPASKENPWKNKHAKIRNYLMVRWLLSLGNRRGELLGIKVSDINFQSNEVEICRRPDDPTDPRSKEPNTKTNGRLLALDDELANLTRSYVLNERRDIRGTRKHEFLWVANGTGAPLSLSGFHKIFITLREKVKELPDSLSAHVMRHTWNDVFSAEIDAAGISEAQEHKMRTRLMGWSDTSSMATVYTRRHIRKKAAEISLAMQAKLRLL